MNGDGSQEHPWEVTNLADLRSLVSVAQAGQYAKLMADIDCNEQCPNGWTTVTLNQHLDLNGFNIIAPMILNGNYLFAANEGVAVYTISNGGILNVFEEFQSRWSIFKFHYHQSSAGGSYVVDVNARYKLENLGMSVYIRNNAVFYGYNDVTQTYGTMTVDKCTLKIMGTNNNCEIQFLNYVQLRNSKIICDYASNGKSLCLYGITRTDIQNCRFEGKVTGKFNLNCRDDATSSPGSIYNGAVINSIILTESTQNATYYTESTTGKSVISSKCNSVAPSSHSAAYIIRMNDDDIKSYSAVNNAGFITIEV